MTPFPYSIDVDDALSRAALLMREHDIRHLPVTEGRTVVGVVSDRDLRVLMDVGGDAGDRTVRDVCVSPAYVVGLDEPLDEVLLAMAERHIGSAIVVKNGRLAGVFTAVDACRCFGEYLRENFPRGDDPQAA